MSIITCYECEEEFKISPAYKTDSVISFCPYCGSSIEDTKEEGIDDIDDNLNFNLDDEDFRN